MAGSSRVGAHSAVYPEVRPHPHARRQLNCVCRAHRAETHAARSDGGRARQRGGEWADGFVGHTIASAGYLRDVARPALATGAARADRDVAQLRITTQIVASAGTDPRAARRDAAAQVGFYSTPKGYDALFPDGQFTAERVAARDALARGDGAGVIAAGEAMVGERAVFGTPEDVADQLRRYAGVVDWALLYPPHFGVDAERVHANELSLIEVASGWTS
jgi:alkanesulfonate monooxygenase SsuD/methylene tetrahydromethanopterin reductase-like flavin-dependent oxidoreductase (luciferase family)